MEPNEFEFVDFWDLSELGEKEAFPLFNNDWGSSVTIPASEFHKAKILNEDEFIKKYNELRSKNYFIHDGEGNEIRKRGGI